MGSRKNQSFLWKELVLMAKRFKVKATGDYDVRTYVSACSDVAVRLFIMLCDTIIDGYATLGMMVDVFNIHDYAVMIAVNGKFASRTVVEFVEENI
jgi:hypothetical protein